MWWIPIMIIGAALFAACFWDSIRDVLTSWLREKGWNKGILMSAVVQVDRLISGVRRRIVVRKKGSHRVHVVEEKEMELNEIDDESVRAELERRGHCECNVMGLLD